MKAVRRSDDFNADVRREWVYLHQFSESVADRFVDQLEETLRLLAAQPGVGHPGRYRHPRLAGLRGAQTLSRLAHLLLGALRSR